MDYLNQIFNLPCNDLLQGLPDNLINCVITSPPYANQRDNLYDSTNEINYPDWTVEWMNFLKPKIKEDGSILIAIRPHIKNGEISDYVLKTRLAVRQAGWKECEELIWHKSDAPPLGSIYRPRRTWESILWFSKTSKPFIDLKACGNQHSKRTGGFVGSKRFGTDVLAANQNPVLEDGTSRISDVFQAKIAEISKNVMHPAMFPQTLSDQLVQTFSRKGDLVFDPFTGSGTTLISAKTFGRNYLGCDTNAEYVEIAQKRLEKSE
jgi:site-specific DNA-methyltransferase (adenine-specific)